MTVCQKFDCNEPATHALLIWNEHGDLEAHWRCAGCGHGDVKAKLVQMLDPRAKTKLVKL